MKGHTAGVAPVWEALFVMGLALMLAVAPARGAGAQEAADRQAEASDVAAISPFNMAMSRWDDLTMGAYAIAGYALGKYSLPETRDGETVLFIAGSMHGLVASGEVHPDWHVAVDAMIGRGLILLKDFDNARRWLESAIEIGEAGGLGDERLNGVLRDLAWLARGRGDEAAAEAYAVRAESCPLDCLADVIWLVSQEGVKFAEEAGSILGSDEFWRRRAEDRRRDAEIFVREQFGAKSSMLARLFLMEAAAIDKAEPAALSLIERAISLLRETGSGSASILPALLLRVQLVEASGDLARAAGLAGELMAEALLLSDPQSLRVAAEAAENRFALLHASGSAAASAAYADAVTVAGWAGGDRTVHRRLLEAGIAAGLDADAGRLADAMLAWDPANEYVLPLRLTLAERMGEQAEIERLSAILNPPPGREPTGREIALARLSGSVGDIARPADSFVERSDRHLQAKAKLHRRSAFSMHTALARLADDDDLLMADAVIARFDLIGGADKDIALRYARILEEAERRGWSEARLSSIVSDLAFLAEHNGDADSADAYRRRAAAACAAPCNEALFREVWIESRLAGMLTARLLGAAEERRARDRYHEDEIAYLETRFGSSAPETIDAWEDWASMARDREDRPWQTIELYRRVLDMRLAAGEAPGDLLGIRGTILRELLKAGEYRRLVEFAGPLIADARAAGNDKLRVEALRHRARALWHLGDPAARQAFRELIATLRAPETTVKADATLLVYLVDARYEEEILEVADLLLEASPANEGALIAKSRVAADRGDYAGAADLLGSIDSPGSVALFQRAFFLDRAGLPDEAARVRRSAAPPGDALSGPAGLSAIVARFNNAINPGAEIAATVDPRDFGAYEGAAEAALVLLPATEEWIAARQYVHAQMLWQIAYTLARGGETTHAFRLMKEAAGIAVSRSFADANDTDGGSLQLLRRDKFRYLLFIDIAWAHISGRPPASMSMSSRY